MLNLDSTLVELVKELIRLAVAYVVDRCWNYLKSLPEKPPSMAIFSMNRRLKIGRTSNRVQPDLYPDRHRAADDLYMPLSGAVC